MGCEKTSDMQFCVCVQLDWVEGGYWKGGWDREHRAGAGDMGGTA